jgi:hypothetical protein
MHFDRLRLAGLAGIVGLASLALTGCGADRATDAGPLAPDASTSSDAELSARYGGHHDDFGKIVVANRGSGSISVLSARDGAVLGTYDLPTDPNPPEPMYVSYVRRTNSVLVGDRANSQVVEFDANSFDVTRTAPAGAGVFHMWVDPVLESQLWVNNDVDNTSTVIDPVTFDVLATVPMPMDLVDLGAKPHDVILGPLGHRAYVTMLSPGDDDWLIQFDTSSFSEVARAAVGKDPHVSLTRRNHLIYVPCQNTNEVRIFNRWTLDPVKTLDVPGAHGAGMAPSGRVFYTTNLPGGGTEGIWAIGTRRNRVIGQPVDTPYAVPHNLAISQNGRRLFLTHSGGTADKVTFYRISAVHPTPVYLGEATVGLNPFGIAYVP